MTESVPLDPEPWEGATRQFRYAVRPRWVVAYWNPRRGFESDPAAYGLDES